MKLSFILALLSFFGAAPAGAACKDISKSGIKSHLLLNTDVQEVRFFASWCVDCKEKVASAAAESVLIAVFESKENADRISETINKSRSVCFFDKDDLLAKAFDVKQLPFSLSRQQALSVLK